MDTFLLLSDEGRIPSLLFRGDFEERIFRVISTSINCGYQHSMFNFKIYHEEICYSMQCEVFRMCVGFEIYDCRICDGFDICRPEACRHLVSLWFDELWFGDWSLAFHIKN